MIRRDLALLLALTVPLLGLGNVARAAEGPVPDVTTPERPLSALGDPSEDPAPTAPAEEPVEAPAAVAPPAATPAAETPAATTSPAAGEPAGEHAVALKARFEAMPEGASDEEKKERAALLAFYAARRFEPVWTRDGVATDGARAVIGEIEKADSWGLDVRDFDLAALRTASGADFEAKLWLAIQKYARFARGGRIIAPSELLNSNLDRRPQLVDPKRVVEEMAAATEAGVRLAGFHPQHEQFQRLRAKYVELRETGKGGSALAKRLGANMEMWRWMHEDLGARHVLANVPEFMMRYVRDGEVVHTERVVVGEIGKQTSIFTRPMKSITLLPMWRVPESIKVRELWPSLRRGGGLMRQHALEVETKDGRRLNWRTMDWAVEDIRNYEVVQPTRGAMGVVKFSFPSQHTIFMHDTPDKWMFNSRRRTLSHGCLRLRNPVQLAELILGEDKGWDADKIAELIRNGPPNNEIPLEMKLKMHLAYFTLWVGDDGKLAQFSDIYGHEKRVTLALDGRWDAIDKGRDHLAPVQPGAAIATAGVREKRGRPQQSALDDFLGGLFGN